MDSRRSNRQAPAPARRGRKLVEARRSLGLMKRLMVGIRTRLDEELRGEHVTAAQLRFLNELRARPGSSGAQLARACYVTPQSSQAMMQRALDHGWIVRGMHPENQRLVTATLTPRGEKLLAQADEVLQTIESEVWSGVSHEKLRAMNAAIEAGLERLRS